MVIFQSYVNVYQRVKTESWIKFAQADIKTSWMDILPENMEHPDIFWGL